MTSSIETEIFDLLAAVDTGRSVSSEQVARAASGDDWRRTLPQVRACAVVLAQQGRLTILRHGKPVDPDAFKGVYRLALPAAKA